MRLTFRGLVFAAALALLSSSALAAAVIPDGRTVEPTGFTIPVEGFASQSVLSPDDKWLAVLSTDGGAVDVISTAKSTLVERIAVASASGCTWTRDGLYVTLGYTGRIARFTYDASATHFTLVRRDDVRLASGLLNGIAEDPIGTSSHRRADRRTPRTGDRRCNRRDRTNATGNRRTLRSRFFE